MAGHATLEETLRRHAREAAPELVRGEGRGRVRCLACGHRCLVGPGRSGVCRVRFNEGGVLRVPTGYVAGLACDPVEKKPFFHFLPGNGALSFGMLGCDLHCSYCQNWVTSQALRDPAALAPIRPVSAGRIVELALADGAPIVCSTYNEPLITSEWAAEVFGLARTAGLRCAFVSNGNATPEVLDYLAPLVDAYKVDLKSFDEASYRRLGGVLGNVLETIRGVRGRGMWLEVVTLVVPGFNDGPEELRAMASFIAGVSPDIPWHVTAFHENYRMRGCGATRAPALVRAAEIGRAEGLRFVYAGNLHGDAGGLEDTRCPGCGATVVSRCGFRVTANRMAAGGRCPECGGSIAGVWG